MSALNTPRMVVDFYHDVVCGWCFVISPRLRILSEELPIVVRHRSFVLQDSRAEMIRRFGSMERAKEEILGHWEKCDEADGRQGRIDIEGMRRQAFEYPSGLAGTIACKAAEAQGGQAAHWNMFDAIQRAHLTDNLNIGDADVLMGIARAVGLEMERFEADFLSPSIRLQVEADRTHARALGVWSVPTLAIEEIGIGFGTAPLPELRAQLLAALKTFEARQTALSR